jgi:hypothetical protein
MKRILPVLREVGWRYSVITLLGALYCLIAPRLYYRGRR